MTRPEGKFGDTGLMWAGWHRAASESLMHATRDDDPRCVIVLCGEAVEAGQEAIRQAKNPRQRKTTEKLIEAALEAKKLAQEHPEDM